jgi:hypothetical protein
VFCDGVASDAFYKMSGVDIVAIIFVDIFMYLFGCFVCLFVARLPWPTKYVNEPKWVSKWRFSRKDAVAIMVKKKKKKKIKKRMCHVFMIDLLSYFSIVALLKRYQWVFR